MRGSLIITKVLQMRGSRSNLGFLYSGMPLYTKRTNFLYLVFFTNLDSVLQHAEIPRLRI